MTQCYRIANERGDRILRTAPAFLSLSNARRSEACIPLPSWLLRLPGIAPVSHVVERSLSSGRTGWRFWRSMLASGHARFGRGRRPSSAGRMPRATIARAPLCGPHCNSSQPVLLLPLGADACWRVYRESPLCQRRGVSLSDGPASRRDPASGGKR